MLRRMLAKGTLYCRPWAAELIASSLVLLILTKEAVMVSLPKIIGLLSCGVALGLGVPNNGQEINNYAQQLKELRAERDADGQVNRPVLNDEEGQTIYGELLQVKHNQYLVRKYDGEIVR